MAEAAASAFLRAGYGKDTSVALFLGNSPDHPVNFFGALKAGARVVHLSPLDGEIALSHKLTRLRRARAGHQQSRGAVADRAEISRQGPARSPDRLRGRSIGARSAIRRRRFPTIPPIVTFRQFVDGATTPAQWPVDHRRRRRAAAIYRRHHRPAEGRDAQPRQSDLGGVDLRRLGPAARAERNADRARDLRAAAVSHLRADGGAAVLDPARQSDLAAPALRRRGRDARHRGQARHRVSRRADDVDRDREPARSRQARSVVAGELAAPAARRCRSRSRRSSSARSA